MKAVVYTAIFNDYDWLKEPVIVPENIDFICYTDSKTLKSKHWRIVRVDLKDKTPSLMNREIKLLYPYSELKEYDYSLYVDGSVMIKGDVGQFINKYTENHPILMNFKHPNKDCLFTEIDYCKIRGRGNAEKLSEQYRIYKDEGMPEHFGLSDNKILLRDNHSELGEEMMREWYHHVITYSGRDQVCLPFILYKHHRFYNFFEESIEKNDCFETWPHNTEVWYIRYWRKVKWFCERHHMMLGTISFLESHIKPKLLGK